MIGADGSGRRQLTHAGCMSTFAAWSPDGAEITFVHVEPNTAGYAVIRADGTGLRVSPLSAGPFRECPVEAGRPAWKPDPRPVQ